MTDKVVQKITHRFTGSVLFECEVDASLSFGARLGSALRVAIGARANLAGANLADAYLAGANLADAYLARANLAGANLAGANLGKDGLDLGSGMRASIVPVQVSGLDWPVLISDSHIKIGCQVHATSSWASFNDRAIIPMDRGALRFWKKWKAAIMATAEAHQARVKVPTSSTAEQPEAA